VFVHAYIHARVIWKKKLSQFCNKQTHIVLKCNVPKVTNLKKLKFPRSINVWFCLFQQCSLHDILDEDNVLQELKSQNKKLVDLYVTHVCEMF
jgi:hypothetical protein